MNIQVEQPCPQCGGAVTLSVEDHLLTCPYCGVKSLLQTSGAARYVLPAQVTGKEHDQTIYAPYLRFKGTIFTVSEAGISHKVLDTTQDGGSFPGLPPSLGLRPQAMKLARVHKKTRGHFLPLALNIQNVLKKAARIHSLSRKDNVGLYHRAYIGETLSYIYLPLLPYEEKILDAVLNEALPHADAATLEKIHTVPFQPHWQIKFLASLCPRCGWNLEGKSDCLVLTCSNCDTAWQIAGKGLSQVTCTILPGPSETGLYLPFWRLKVDLPAVKITSFADFIRRTNQPLVPRKEWEQQAMEFWIPAFKLRPKIFLRTAKQATVSQWRLPLKDQEKEMQVIPNMYPVTLPLSEARQSLKVVLAKSATNKRKIYPYLPSLQPQAIASTLTFLPFKDRHHDWVQIPGGTTITKSVLEFGRAL
jgi:DNA-directed RNA polymerase subunit RPC12/RpoP